MPKLEEWLYYYHMSDRESFIDFDTFAVTKRLKDIYGIDEEVTKQVLTAVLEDLEDRNA